MSKVRIYEVAKELGMEQKALVALFQSMGFGEVRNHMSSVEPDAVERVRRHIEKQKSSSVVEERVRADGRVIKRRTVARPETMTPKAETSVSVRAPHSPAAAATSVAPKPSTVAPVHPHPVATQPAAHHPPEPAAPPAPGPSVAVAAPASPVPVAAVQASPAVASPSAAAPAPVAPAPPVVASTATAVSHPAAAEPQSLPQEPSVAASAAKKPDVSAPSEPHLPATAEEHPAQAAPVARTAAPAQPHTPAPAQTTASVPAAPAHVEPTPEPAPPAEDQSTPAPQRPTDDVGAPAVFAEPEPMYETTSVSESPSERSAEFAPPPVSVPVPAPAPVPVVPVAVSTPAPPAPPPVEQKPQPAVQAAPTRSAAPAAASNPPTSAPTPSTPAPTTQRPPAVRTGIETWAGRPGVPMPQPAARGASGPVPRRVQYDPRTGQTTGGPPRQGGPRSGPTVGGRPMGRSGGPGGGPRRGAAAAPRRPAPAVSTQEMSAHKKVIKIEEKVSLQTLASRMSLKATEVLLKLLQLGMTGVNINSTLDADTAKLLASEFGWEVENVAVSEEAAIEAARSTDGVVGERLSRPPIVTVMGHVDHGKTSLLDRIRKANVAAGEAGGITQHIGAYRVQTSKGMITFLDTPGHEAFTQMRARGASVTDIVVLVVAADDGVMPQTKEAIAHAKAAKVPIIVAINKMDKPGADPERVRRELVDLGLVPEAWGGDTIYCEVSAKAGTNVDQLLEMIALQAEILELKANAKQPATGTVIEALLDRGKGPVARVLVTDGTLHTGDIVLAGPAWGKVRAMTDEHGRSVAEAGPATPIELLGLSDVPNAGDPLHVIKDPKKAQEIADSRKSKVRNLGPTTARVSLEEIAKRMAEADQLELRLIVKADVQGSVEAVADALAKLSTDKVRVSIIHAGVGGITEGDINLAVAAKAIIIGFGVRPAGKAGSLAESEGIEIRQYNVIYTAVDDVKKAMAGLLAPKLVEKALGKAEVRQVFRVSKTGAIAGCMVSDGTIKRSGKARLVRDAIQIWEGKIAGLRRFKDDVGHVEHGMECGIMLEGYSDVKENDVIECFEIEEVAASL